MRKRTAGALFVVLLLGAFGLAYGVGQASAQLSNKDRPRATLARQHEAATPTPTPSPSLPAAPRPDATSNPTVKPTAKSTPKPGAPLLGPGDQGEKVRDLQARLKQIAWYYPAVTGGYDTVTSAAVKGFQAKRRVPVTGVVDQRTLDR
ncbi:MAG: peptidoglycan-binding domain-containing protein, partial [Marmoricola sp.]